MSGTNLDDAATVAPGFEEARIEKTSATNTVAEGVEDEEVPPSKLESGEVAKPAGPPAGLTFPDGGLEAWSVVVGGWLVLFSTFGYVNAFGVYQVYYVTALGKSDSQVAWIGSFQLWLQFTAGLVVGKVFDEGYGKVLIIGGSLFYIFCLFMVSLCKEYWQVFLAQGVGIGLSLGVLFLPAISVIPQWFRARRALATGIVVSGSSVGGVVFPIMLNKLIASHGYAFAVRATAYVITGCLLVACVLIKFRIPGRSKRPAHMQLPPPDFKAILRHQSYWFTIIGGFFIMWGLFLPIFYSQTFAELHGVDSNLSFYLISILNAASVFGRVLPNFLADKFGNFNLLLISSGCTAVLIFVWPVATSKASIIVIDILFGFFTGAYVSLMPGCFASLSSHVGEIGVRMGFAWGVIAIAALTGPPIQGALLGDGPFHWWPPAAFAGSVVAFGTLVMTGARVLHAREKGTHKI